MKHKFKFSVIVPIYNVEEYLEDTISSVINQTINFKEYIQIILVNDGSTDNSEEICIKYSKKYPDNIIYIKQKNSGVSAARNAGIKYAEGEYINFLDSDDIWQKGVFKKALKMFRKYPQIPMIGVKQKFFEAANGYTPLNYKFEKGTRIVDITKEFDKIQLSITSAFIRREYIKDLRFDTKIKYSEDAKFIYEVFIKNKKTTYGLIADQLHLYRKRYSQNSAIQTKDLNQDWYFVTTELAYKYLLELAYNEFPELVRTIGYYITYDYQWRIKRKLDLVLNEQQKEQYLKITKYLLDRIPNECILEQKQIDSIEKNVLLSFKYNGNYTDMYNQLKKAMHIDFFEVKDDKIIIEGYSSCFKNNEINYYVKINNEIQKLEMIERKYPNKNNCLEVNTELIGFKLKLELKNIESLEFHIEFNDNKEKMILNFGNFAKLWEEKSAYYKYKNNIMYVQNNKIFVKHNQGVVKCFFKEVKYLLKFKSIKTLIIRILYNILFISKKQIWIFSERQAVAGDNAEAIFKYVNEQKNKKIKPYFVIEKGSKDIIRLKEYGKVIHYNTLRYMLLFLKSTYIISSHSEPYTTNCFGKNLKWFKDLLKFKYVFLQHGIIRNNLSDWLNKYNKNIAMFVTTTELEQKSIISDYPYSYDENVVKLTGLPRYDKLYKNDIEEKKQILILPTWRSYLAGPRINRTQKRMYNNNFRNSYFFQTYNSLINDERIIEALKKYGYKIKFCLHPSLAEQSKDFDANEYAEVCKENIDYQYEFKTNKVLITDYSSVSCDFAYLNKLVIYLKGDKEEFFKNHIYEEGFFDEEKDGFGPICYDYESIVKTIIDLMKNDFKLEEKYEKNIDKFFKYRDDNNCARVYEELLKLSNS